MTKIIKLSDHKQKKKAKRIISDLEQLIKIHELTLQALKHFSRYATTQETISVVNANKILLEIHLKKYRNIVDKK